MDKTILVIEDQHDINTLIALNLRVLNYHVESVLDGKEGFDKAISRPYDVIVLDIMLPGMDGLTLCKALRERDITTPILMLTAKKTEIERVTGLEAGADDYLTKPFSVLELQARVKALIRRSSINQKASEESQSLTFNNLFIHKKKRQVIHNEQSLNLTAKEFDLLAYLASHPGQVFSREQLLNAVWGYQHSGYEHTVNSHINRLRSKLEQDPADPKYVTTVWGVGYKFDV